MDQAIDRNLSCSYSLSVPGHQIYEVQTIIVTCSEIEGKLPAADLERLQPHAYLTLPGGRFVNSVDAECSLDTLCFLEALMMSARNVEHVVVCFHTGCKYRSESKSSVVSLFDELDDQRLRSIEKPHADEFLLLRVQKELAEEINALKSVCERNAQLNRKKLTFHGWLYESEIDWVSFLDADTGLFLPLSANTALCR